MTEGNINPSANDKKKLANKCCICGKEFEGYGNNPAPYKEDGCCCNECNRDYVMPSRSYLSILYARNLSEKKVKDEMRKFREQYRVFPYNCNDKLILEIGKRIINGIQNKGFSMVSSMETDTLIEGRTVPICTMTKSEVIECMEKYLSSTGKTLDCWIIEGGYKLYWHKLAFLVANKGEIPDINSKWVEPLIDFDTDSTESDIVEDS